MTAKVKPAALLVAAPAAAGHGGSYVANPETSEVALVERGGRPPAAAARRGFGAPSDTLPKPAESTDPTAKE